MTTTIKTIFTLSLLTINSFAATNVKDFSHLAGSRNSHTVLKEVLEEHPLVIAKCFLTYCPKCQNIAPTFSTMADKYQDKALFLDINVGAFDEIGNKFDVTSRPTFLIFMYGKLAKKIRGSGNLPEVDQYIASIIKKMT